MATERKRESVAAAIIIGAVLIGALALGVYGIRQLLSGDDNRNNDTSEVSEDNGARDETNADDSQRDDRTDTTVESSDGNNREAAPSGSRGDSSVPAAGMEDTIAISVLAGIAVYLLIIKLQRNKQEF